MPYRSQVKAKMKNIKKNSKHYCLGFDFLLCVFFDHFFAVYFVLKVLLKGCTVAQLVALLPFSEKDLGSTSDLGSCCMEFARSPCTGIGSRQVLRLTPTVQKHDY
ncbi:hypothetical protein ILYODFUR_027350 [Ilyodon furcidens]|uniref:Uncharacterized protein n=1 Tax=Ilyodon furcidens TaxID=33524 RepID=A0ABV0TDD6_9TELE